MITRRACVFITIFGTGQRVINYTSTWINDFVDWNSLNIFLQASKVGGVFFIHTVYWRLALLDLTITSLHNNTDRCCLTSHYIKDPTTRNDFLFVTTIIIYSGYQCRLPVWAAGPQVPVVNRTQTSNNKKETGFHHKCSFIIILISLNSTSYLLHK